MCLCMVEAGRTDVGVGPRLHRFGWLISIQSAARWLPPQSVGVGEGMGRGDSESVGKPYQERLGYGSPTRREAHPITAPPPNIINAPPAPPPPPPAASLPFRCGPPKGTPCCCPAVLID